MKSDNTSDDTEGEDSSFASVKEDSCEKSNSKSEGERPKENQAKNRAFSKEKQAEKSKNLSLFLTQEINDKKLKYASYIKRLYGKNDELEEVKIEPKAKEKQGMKEENIKKKNRTNGWMKLYLTFFGGIKNMENISLNEINLRCKMLFKMDGQTRCKFLSSLAKSKSTDDINNKCNQPNTRIMHKFTLADFIKNFNEKEYSSTSAQFYVKRKTSDLKRNLNEKPLVFGNNSKNLTKLYKKHVLAEEEKTGKNLALNKSTNSSEIPVVQSTKHSNKRNKNRSGGNVPLFCLYGVTDNIDEINKVLLKSKLKKSSKNFRDNVLLLKGDQKLYEIELEEFFKGENGPKFSTKKEAFYKDFYLNCFRINSSKIYRELDSFGPKILTNKFSGQERFGIYLNDFYVQILSKVSPLYKVNG